LNTSTVNNIGPALSAKTTETGGTLAVSSKATLTAAFPASPILGADPDYSADVVTAMKFKLLTNTVVAGDKSEAQSYYGFSAANSSEEIPESGDLSFNGAPIVPGVTKDSNGNLIASPYMPNLVPPVHMNGAPDNISQAVMTIAEAHGATTPGVGNGLLSPRYASDGLQSLVDSLEDADTPISLPWPAGTSSDPVSGT